MRKFLALLLASCLAFSPLAFSASDGTYFDTDTKLMLYMDGTDASTTFTDSSASAHSVTAGGNAQIDTAQSKFGGASGLFDGTGDYLSSGNHADYDLGTGNFNIDAWIRYTGVGNTYFTVFSTTDALSTEGYILFYTAPIISFRHLSGGVANIVANKVVTFNADTWYHIMVSRSGNDFFLGWDGAVGAAATTDADSSNSTGGGFVIGRLYIDDATPAYDTSGWIDELRVVKGTAVWTGDFTPPSAAYIPTPTTSIKTVNGLAYASVKTKNGLAMASVKNINGLA